MELASDQNLIWGPDLKADLAQIVERYKGLPEAGQEKGMMKFARVPPEGSPVAKLLHDFGAMLKRQEQERIRRLLDETPTRAVKPFPTAEPDLVKHLNRFKDAPELSPEEVDFDTANPDILSVQRSVHKRRGSFWQLPKNLKLRISSAVASLMDYTAVRIAVSSCAAFALLMDCTAVSSIVCIVLRSSSVTEVASPPPV
jgi:hypothetical protein